MAYENLLWEAKDGVGIITMNRPKALNALNGRTVAELGTRLTPAHLMERAKATIKDATVERTRAVAQTAGDMATDVAERTRQAAVEATDQVRANPGGAAAAAVGLVLGIWAARQAASRSQRSPLDGRYHRVDATAGQITAAAAAVAVAWYVWKGGRLLVASRPSSR